MIPYGRHCIEEDDIAAVVEVLGGDYLTSGPMIDRFEEAFAKRTTAKYAVVCSSGTAALHLATMALKLGPGQAAIVPSITFLATANAVRFTGAEVIFADVDPETGLMRAEHFEEAIERGRKLGWNVRAVFPVHLNGQCVDVEAIASVADREDISVVIDASHAVGAEHLVADEWRPVGSGLRVRMTTFSFHPVKTIAMGEGGAVTTNCPMLAGRLRLLRSHGMSRDPDQFTERAQALDAKGEPHRWYYEMQEPGLNYRASDIHCALGLSQLGKLGRFVEARRELADRYDALLTRFAPILRPIRRVPYCRPAWHLYPVLIRFDETGISRDIAMSDLRENGFATQVHYIPVHRQPYYSRRYAIQRLEGADDYYERILTLPLYLGITAAEQQKVCDLLCAALRI